MTTSTVYTQVKRVSEDICAKAMHTSVSDLHEAMGGTLAKAHSSKRWKKRNIIDSNVTNLEERSF
jgi:hypothetical protein